MTVRRSRAVRHTGSRVTSRALDGPPRDAARAVPSLDSVIGYPPTEASQIRLRLVDAATFGRCCLSTGEAGKKRSDRPFRPELPLAESESAHGQRRSTGRRSSSKIHGRYTDAPLTTRPMVLGPTLGATPTPARWSTSWRPWLLLDCHAYSPAGRLVSTRAWVSDTCAASLTRNASRLCASVDLSASSERYWTRSSKLTGFRRGEMTRCRRRPS